MRSPGNRLSFQLGLKLWLGGRANRGKVCDVQWEALSRSGRSPSLTPALDTEVVLHNMCTREKHVCKRAVRLEMRM